MVKSPCINICTINSNSGLCIGCNRTQEKINNWVTLGFLEKKQVLERIQSRNQKKLMFKEKAL